MGDLSTMFQFWKEVWMFLGSMVLFFIIPAVSVVSFIYFIMKGLI